MYKKQDKMMFLFFFTSVFTYFCINSPFFLIKFESVLFSLHIVPLLIFTKFLYFFFHVIMHL